jgi:hypothetical protein
MTDLKTLRQHPFVQAWIADYQKDTNWHKYLDCRSCGFPHAENILCGCGATFGCLRIGGEMYYVDASNVAFFVQFRERSTKGFHWRDDIYFLRQSDGDVKVTSYWQYNNCPQERRWVIPADEWASVVASVSAQGETSESWQKAKKFHASSY